MAPRPSATIGAGGLATAAQLAPGAAGRASPTKLTVEQANAYFLTPQQQQEIFDRRQGAEAALREGSIGDTEAQGQFDRAMAALNLGKAQQAQAATDEMIARGLLQSGTARGALADITTAAANQAAALEAALLSTKQRNLAVTSQAQEALGRLPGYAQAQGAENIATGVRSMPGAPALPPQSAYAKPTSPPTSQVAQPAGPAPSKAPGGFRPFQPSWMQPPAMQAAAKRKTKTKSFRPGAPGPGGPSGRV